MAGVLQLDQVSSSGRSFYWWTSDRDHLNNRAAATVAAWVRVNDWGADGYTLLAWGASHRLRFTGSAGQIRFEADGSLGHTIAVAAGEWVHVAFTHDAAAVDGKRQKLYVDGVEVATTNVPGNTPATDGRVTAGGDAATSSIVRYESVAVWHRAVLAAEAVDLASQAVDPQDNGLQVLYQFETETIRSLAAGETLPQLAAGSSYPAWTPRAGTADHLIAVDSTTGVVPPQPETTRQLDLDTSSGGKDTSVEGVCPNGRYIFLYATLSDGTVPASAPQVDRSLESSIVVTADGTPITARVQSVRVDDDSDPNDYWAIALELDDPITAGQTVNVTLPAGLVRDNAELAYALGDGSANGVDATGDVSWSGVTNRSERTSGNAEAYAARWMDYPNRLLAAARRYGVIAGHASGITSVAFSIDGGSYTAAARAWSDDHDWYCWSVEADPTGKADGTLIEIDCRVTYGNGFVKNLPTMTAYANTGATAVTKRLYVDAAGGDDANDGLTPATAKQTLMSASAGVQTATCCFGAMGSADDHCEIEIRSEGTYTLYNATSSGNSSAAQVGYTRIYAASGLNENNIVIRGEVAGASAEVIRPQAGPLLWDGAFTFWHDTWSTWNNNTGQALVFEGEHRFVNGAGTALDDLTNRIRWVTAGARSYAGEALTGVWMMGLSRTRRMVCDGAKYSPTAQTMCAAHVRYTDQFADLTTNTALCYDLVMDSGSAADPEVNPDQPHGDGWQGFLFTELHANTVLSGVYMRQGYNFQSMYWNDLAATAGVYMENVAFQILFKDQAQAGTLGPPRTQFNGTAENHFLLHCDIGQNQQTQMRGAFFPIGVTFRNCIFQEVATPDGDERGVLAAALASGDLAFESCHFQQGATYGSSPTSGLLSESYPEGGPKPAYAGPAAGVLTSSLAATPGITFDDANARGPFDMADEAADPATSFRGRRSLYNPLGRRRGRGSRQDWS